MEFSIYLSESTGDPQSFVKASSLPLAQSGNSDIGSIYLFPPDAKPPKWVSELRSAWPNVDFSALYSARPGVLATLAYQGKTFVITFGTGYLHVDKDKIIPDFGRKVVISCVSSKDLKQVSRQALEGAKLQSIEQTPKGESIDKYSIDVERDLLKGLAGSPRKQAFGDFMAGADALHVAIPGGISELKKRFRLYMKAYSMKIISPDLKWFDRLKRVLDHNVKAKLDEKLDAAIQRSNQFDPLLMLPEIIDRTRIFTSYGFQHSTSRAVVGRYTDPVLDDWRHWLATKRLQPSLAEARSKYFYVYDPSGLDVDHYRIVDCLLWSCNLSGKSFFLHNSVWYEISQSLVKDVQYFLLNAYKTKSHVKWPTYTGGDEASYNAGVPAQIPNMLLMDKSNITLRGAKSAIEPCDLIDLNSKLLVFVKRKKVGSSGLAHLFAQVMNGAEVFFGFDSEMREEMKKRMQPPQPNFNPSAQINPSQWTIVILILGKKKQRSLPFFSLMTAKQTITALKKRYGVDVCIEYA